MITKIINEIVICSKRIETTLEVTQKLLYKRFPIQILIGKIGKRQLGKLLPTWFESIYKNFATRACTNTAAARCRSPVTIALMGL